MRPWTRWWWLGSAVDTDNLTRLLEEYQRVGLGGVEITPLYGVQGQESRDIDYLSARWLEMLTHTLTEAQRLGLGVDMPTGTGWPFGGPQVTNEDAEDKLVIEKMHLAGGLPFVRSANERLPQALTAVSDSGQTINLRDQILPDGAFHWTPPPGQWTVYSVTQKWAGRRVKRAAPGSEGKCINPFSRQSLLHYLQRFDDALADLPPGALRCHFHNSFEYLADWSPDLFAEFQSRRGYDLRNHLPALAGDGDPEKSARVRTDYRETLADLLLQNFTQTWTNWAHGKGSLSRNQAHGSPGNLLDLYGTVDIPETEIFGGPGDPRASKFASSAAHVLGKPLTSSESCTWLGEHFTVSLAQCKAALDRLLVSGINHIFYHGTAYSPADAAWPGWLFYASTTFAPQDPLWLDFPTLNAYLTRCQSLLQAGRPDNDVLLYWPLHDLWQTRPDAYMLEINGKWLTDESVGETAQRLWDGGFAYDYISDHQLALAQADKGGIRLPGGHYQAILVPPCRFMPEQTLQRLTDLAGAGAAVIFQDHLPGDVPGWHDLLARRERFQAIRLAAENGPAQSGPDLEALLTAASVRRETMTAHEGIQCIRRRLDDGHYYFLINEGEDALDGWVEIATPFTSAILMDPMTGETGAAAVDHITNQPTRVSVQIPPGASLFVRTFEREEANGQAWRYQQPANEPMALEGVWKIDFLAGGPELPPAVETETLGSWTEQGGEETQRFAGTARYTLTFDAPRISAQEWELDLGRVCESARVRLNGEWVGTLIAPPYCLRLHALKPFGNLLEIEVTNLAANRIRDMDKRGMPWKIFREINFVNIAYQPFDASEWPIHESGHLGPVRLRPMRLFRPEKLS